MFVKLKMLHKKDLSKNVSVKDACQLSFEPTVMIYIYFIFSGHGLSGMALLSIISVLTTACMFSAAIITAFTMNSMGTLKLS